MNARIRRTLEAIEESVRETDHLHASLAYAAETSRLRDERDAFGQACRPSDRPYNPSAMFEET